MPDAALPARAPIGGGRAGRERWARPGSRHDKVVGVLRVVLPVLIGVLAAFLVMAPLTSASDVSFVLDKNKVEVASERLKIEAAQYRGEDAKGQGFVLRAGEAVQKSSAEPVVQISDLAASIQLPDGPARLSADHGHYDMDTERVTADGPVSFRAADGYRLDTRDATVDLKTRRMQSGGAATGTLPQGRFSANRLTADLENRVVRLDGQARLHIVPRRAR